MELQDRIFVAGHRGLVGGAIVRNLRSKGYDNLVRAGRDTVDLRDKNRGPKTGVRVVFLASRRERPL